MSVDASIACPQSVPPQRATRSVPAETATPPAADATRRVAVLLSRLRSARKFGDGQSNPWPTYEQLRECGDVVPSPWGGVMVTSYEAANAVLRDRSFRTPDLEWRQQQGDVRWNSPANTELSQMMMLLNAPEHTRQRRVLGNTFDRATLERLTPVIEGLVDSVLDELELRMKEDGSADYAEIVGDGLPVAAVGHWLGVPAADFADLCVWTHGQSWAQELFPTASQMAFADESALSLKAYFQDLVAERTKSPGDDVLSSWIRAWSEAEEDPEQAATIVARLASFAIMAGLETTSNLVNAGMWLLDRNPEQADWLRYHPEGIPAATEEILRYDPAVAITTRVGSGSDSPSEIAVGKGQLVYVCIGSAHHDPRFIADPDRFDVRRPGPVRHLAFGQGAHFCLGAGLGRLESNVLLRKVLTRFPTLRVVAEPVWESRAAFRRMASLRVGLAPKPRFYSFGA
ncbi:cytochrome P450 [Streptomyces sp. B-S-A8]|uniref:Cytochrome P450 n=1 Tax=Streptomyces solicavernae TaxID=3043614 RepID=A0ABT6RM09_9ACTN|nr:cytochrome P450 [Streptomyces sp. B-S-A8]MDI3385469.1 cytochrome P450 [Streptomyces sp. B-S-A8]